jgi:hypothetical protein
MKRFASFLLGLASIGCSHTTTQRLRLPELRTVDHVGLASWTERRTPSSR